MGLLSSSFTSRATCSPGVGIYTIWIPPSERKHCVPPSPHSHSRTQPNQLSVLDHFLRPAGSCHASPHTRTELSDECDVPHTAPAGDRGEVEELDVQLTCSLCAWGQPGQRSHPFDVRSCLFMSAGGLCCWPGVWPS
ncbi:hypothetical protein GN956_G19483 [Arapaima gigas]